MPAWIWPALSLAGAAFGAYLGVRILIVRLQTQMESVMERLKIIGDRTHEHANRLTEHGMTIHDLNGRVARLERQEDER